MGIYIHANRIRRKLGIGPGSLLEWEAENEKIVVRRAGRYTSRDVHRALFATPPRRWTLNELNELKEGIRKYV